MKDRKTYKEMLAMGDGELESYHQTLLGLSDSELKTEITYITDNMEYKKVSGWEDAKTVKVLYGDRMVDIMMEISNDALNVNI